MQSDAIQLLHPKVQEILLDRGWGRLYPIQQEAIRRFRETSLDLVIAAPTSGGKTEAVFLPLLSGLLNRTVPVAPSITTLCICPLKALINDQHQRLSILCSPLGVAVHRWHGDVDMEIKRRIRDKPSGILFITPES